MNFYKNKLNGVFHSQFQNCKFQSGDKEVSEKENFYKKDNKTSFVFVITKDHRQP